MMNEPRIFFRHARAAGFCANGTQRVVERYGVDYEKFLVEGYPVSAALKSANPLIRKAAELAQNEWDAQHGK